MQRLRQRGKNKTKSNVNKNARLYLLYMEKGVSAVDEKIQKNDSNKKNTFLRPILQREPIPYFK